jgi:tetratricopeptide (TPR) repeat protein
MRLASCLRLLPLLALLAAGITLQGARKESWVEVKSPHFVAYSDAGEAEARKALMGFEGIRSVFGTAFHGIRVDPPKPMVVIVVADEASMKRFLPEHFQGKDPSRPAGVFVMRPDRNYAILRLDIDYQDDQPYFVLFHEYTHSIVHQNFPSLPTWLDEGIADFYGATQIQSDHVFIGRVPRGRLDLLRSSVRLPLETLLTVTQDSPHYREGEKTGIFYAQSWAFAHYLFMDEGARKARLFQAYMKALGHGGDALSAAQEGFGDLAKLKGTLTAYTNQPRFFFWNLPLTVKLTDKDFQARPLLERALALAPQRAEVQVAMGYGHTLRGEQEAANGAFLSAIQLRSTDFRPPYYLATLAQEHLGSGTADNQQILAWLESARNLRPDFPAVHMALCRQYTWDPRDPAKVVQEGRAAVNLEPKNLANLANFGSACMSLDLEKDAREVGEALQRAATTQGEKGMAQSYQQAFGAFLERRKAPAAQPPNPGGESGASPSTASGAMPPFKYSLPSYLAPLGQEVLQLVEEGHLDEAIQKVEKAISKARYAYDRKALKPLLESLRARRSLQQDAQRPAGQGKATPTPRDGAN